MLATVALYVCVLAVYLPGLCFALNPRLLLRHPVVGFGFLGMFVYNAVGSVLVMRPDLVARPDYYRPEFAAMLIVQALLYYAVVGPYIRMAPAGDFQFQGRAVDNALAKVVLGAIALLTVFYIFTVGVPPLVKVVFGGLSQSEILSHRTQHYYGHPLFWLFNLTFTVLPTFVAIVAIALRQMNRISSFSLRATIVVCLGFSALPGGKGAVLEYCVSVLIAWFLMCGWTQIGRADRPHVRSRFQVGKAIVYMVGAMLLVLGMYRLYRGPTVSVPQTAVDIAYRVVGAYSEPMAGSVVFVEECGFLEGSTLPTIRGLLGHERFRVGHCLHKFMYLGPGTVTLSAPTEGYVNFGWVGFVGFCLLAFATLIAVERCILAMPRNTFSASLLAMYAVFATKIATITIFANFISLTNVVLVAVLAGLYVFLGAWLRLANGPTSPQRTRDAFGRLQLTSNRAGVR